MRGKPHPLNDIVLAVLGIDLLQQMPAMIMAMLIEPNSNTAQFRSTYALAQSKIQYNIGKELGSANRFVTLADIDKSDLALHQIVVLMESTVLNSTSDYSSRLNSRAILVRYVT